MAMIRGSRIFPALFAGKCATCGVRFKKGTMIARLDSGYGHADDCPSNVVYADGDKRARKATACDGCGVLIRKGSPIFTRAGNVYHGTETSGCRPSGDPKADAEYYAGARDYDRYRENAALFGEDYAAAEELAWDLKTGWDY